MSPDLKLVCSEITSTSSASLQNVERKIDSSSISRSESNLNWSNCKATKIIGKIVDATNNMPAKNITLSFTDSISNTVLNLKTDVQGQFSGTFKPSKHFIQIPETSLYAAYSESVELCDSNLNITIPLNPKTASLNEASIRIIMRWINQNNKTNTVETVEDVDSYLTTPDGQTIYYGNKGSEPNLDRDDTDWGGPETVTIKNPLSGEYEYCVDNYSNRHSNTALGNSEIKIDVYKGNKLERTFKVPPGTGLKCAVFKISNGTIIPINQFKTN